MQFNAVPIQFYAVSCSSELLRIKESHGTALHVEPHEINLHGIAKNLEPDEITSYT